MGGSDFGRNAVLRVGQIIETDDFGRHRIERLLGMGGMGVVYETVKLDRDPRAGAYRERHYAVKALREEYWERQDVLDRLYTEAGVLRSHDHENLLPVHGLCWTTNTPKRMPLIFMDLLEGASLRETMNGCESFQLWAICTVAQGILSALQYIHKLHLIHRDIKPENIFLRKRGEHYRVVLMDFGIVKEVLPGDNTKEGHFIGTDGYCAPEQILGGKITPRTDLYAVSCVLYEMFTGRPVFPDVNEPDAIKVAHLTRNPTPLHALVPAVPRALLDMTMQGLEKDPARRPADANIYAEPFSIAFMEDTRKAGRTTMEQMLRNNVLSVELSAPRKDATPQSLMAGQKHTMRMALLPQPVQAASVGSEEASTEPSAPPSGVLPVDLVQTSPSWNAPVILAAPPAAAVSPEERVANSPGQRVSDAGVNSVQAAGSSSAVSAPPASAMRGDAPQTDPAVRSVPGRSSSREAPIGDGPSVVISDPLPIAPDPRTWGAAGAITSVPDAPDATLHSSAGGAAGSERSSASPPAPQPVLPSFVKTVRLFAGDGIGSAPPPEPVRKTTTTDPSTRPARSAPEASDPQDLTAAPQLPIARPRLGPIALSVCAGVVLAALGLNFYVGHQTAGDFGSTSAPSTAPSGLSAAPLPAPPPTAPPPPALTASTPVAPSAADLPSPATDLASPAASASVASAPSASATLASPPTTSRAAPARAAASRPRNAARSSDEDAQAPPAPASSIPFLDLYKNIEPSADPKAPKPKKPILPGAGF